ncbi:MAG: chromosome segregation protein SMC [Bacteriovoracales bacterium]|nr:chromosome segregation protein SMC [Bacteriovoracales bacterium]
MRLKKLILQGFKSFKDKTSVYFNDGVTGIVGPNGCGKSNIVDALFWVMGEQSAKHLRGKSMKDLIFAGSSSHGPGAFAEVILVLENTNEKHIHIGKKVTSPREIQISRKLYRNGDSEYRINTLPARLRDIQEIFMDTGAGAKSYSVIAQGEINRLVQSRPEERRSMIEEVAGITKFKRRKTESLRKIEQTNLNLSRLKDLQTEIGKNMKLLEGQAEKAKKARSLKKKVEKGELVINSHLEFNLLKNFTELNRFVRDKEIKIAQMTAQKESFEINLEKERLQRTQLTDEIEAERQKLNKESQLLARNEERLNSMRAAQTEKISFIEMKVKENAHILEETKERKEKLKDLTERLELLKACENDQNEYPALKAKAQEMKEELDLKEKTLSDLYSELDGDKNDHFETERKLVKTNSKLEELAQTLEDISVEKEDIEETSSSVSKELAHDRDAASEAKKKVKTLEDELHRLVSQAKKVSDQKRELSKKDHLLTKDLLKKESQLESLEALNDAHEDQKEGVQEFLKNFQNECSLFGKLIDCDEKDTCAVQAALATRLNSIVTETKTCESHLFEWPEKKKLSADFLVSKTQRFSTLPNARPLLESIVISKEASTIQKEKIEALLEGIFIVDRLDENSLESLKETHFAVIVSGDGKRVVENLGNALKVRSFGQDGDDQTIIARNHLIQCLRKETALMTKELEEKRKTTLELNEQEKKITQDKENRETQLLEEKIKLSAANATLKTKLSHLGSKDSRTKILEKRTQDISKERLEMLEREEKLSKRLEELKEIVDQKKNIIAETTAEVHGLKEKYTSIQEEFLTKQIELKNFEDRVSSLKQQLHDTERQMTQSLEKLQENDGVIAKYEESLKGLEETATELQERTGTDANLLKEKESKLSEMKDRLSELLITMQDREDEVKKLSQDISKDEKNTITKAAKRDQAVIDEEHIVRNIFEKYQVDLREGLASFLELGSIDLEGLADVSTMYYMETESEDENQETQRTRIKKVPFEFRQRYGQDLKEQKEKLKRYKQALGRIGEINWKAIEDYDRQKVRHDFLKAQEGELKTSLSDLENAISLIDEKSKKRFKQAFDDVNDRFEKVFPIIFGGGDAKLKTVGDLDDPECGIDIMASPPGKKMQNINLMSGGEKALTAVGLIFSIFLVKPSPFCLLDEVDAPLDDANIGRFNELLKEMSDQSQFILITHNKKTMEFNDTLYGITMQEPGISSAVSVQLQ